MKKVKLSLGTVIALAALAVTGVALAHAVTVIKGTPKDDALTGTPGKDLVFARAGNDTVNAGADNDRVHGMRGNDTLNGEDGNDRMWPGRGTDRQMGGDGDDVLHALARDRQVDQIDCGPGNDTVWLNAKEQAVHVNCEVVKTVTVKGNGGDD